MGSVVGYEVVPLALWARFALGNKLWGRSPLTPFELRARSYTRFEVGLFHKPWDVSHYKSPYPSSVQNERRKNMLAYFYDRVQTQTPKASKGRKPRAHTSKARSAEPRPHTTTSPQTFRLCNRLRRVLRRSRFPRVSRGSAGVQCCVRCNAGSDVHRIPVGKHLPQSHQVPHPKA